MDFTNLLAGAALVVNDFVAVVAVATCIGSLFVGLFNLGAEPGYRKSDPFIAISLFCMIIGSIGQIALSFQHIQPDTIGFIFRLSVPVTNLLFMITLFGLVLRMIVLRRRFDAWAKQ